ncbi:MAG: hypothetical protein ACOX4P_07760 [Anaerovoracaceae bacterium]|jgi:hypothetical protein
MSSDYYKSNPDLKEYFESLPLPIQNALSESGVEITTLGELKQCAEHMMQND